MKEVKAIKNLITETFQKSIIIRSVLVDAVSCKMTKINAASLIVMEGNGTDI
jgi:hypothetical protein